MIVWVQVHSYGEKFALCCVEYTRNGSVYGLKRAVKAECPEFKDICAGRFKVFKAGAQLNDPDQELNPGATVPDDTTWDAPLLVDVPRHVPSTPGKPKTSGSQKATPGSQANASRKFSTILVESLQNTEYDILLGDKRVSGAALSSDLIKELEATDNIVELLYSTVGGCEEDFSSEKNDLADLDFLLLRNEAEKNFQENHLQKHFFNVKNAKAEDLSTATANGPFFKPATTIGPGLSVATLSAKPDGTSTVVPMDLEIKSDKKDIDNIIGIDCEVLNQAVERLSMRMRMQGFLKMAIAFAVTGRSAWYVFVSRAQPMSNPRLRLQRIHHDAVGKMWMRITEKASSEPGFFLSEDGTRLCDVIRKIGATPWCCLTKALARSQSVVYGVTVPRRFTGASSVGVEVSLENITYAVKIIRDRETYEVESEALRKIAEKADPQFDFYALGCAPCGDGQSQKFRISDEWDTGETFASTEQYWWDTITLKPEEEGGGIIMRLGTTTAQEEFGADQPLSKDVRADLVYSLHLAHSAEVLHCDLRRSNFVKFGESWQVIDYGLSTGIKSSKSYKLAPGEQANCAGYRVKKLWEGRETESSRPQTQWTAVDDYQMLMANT